MDIVVTIPKSEYKNDDAETELMQREGGCQFWCMKKMPTNLHIGDRVYFVRDGKVESSMRVIDIRKNGEQSCDTTFRQWRGHLIYMNDLRQETLPFKIKGFQGFRYRWWGVPEIKTGENHGTTGLSKN